MPQDVRNDIPLTEVARLTDPSQKLWERVSDTSIRVYRKAMGQLLEDTTLAWCPRDPPDSWLIEQRADGELYCDGKKIELHLIELQKRHKKLLISGGYYRGQIDMARVLDPNIMDALVEAWEQGLKLIPESWKQDECGNPLYIIFWAVGYRYLDGRLAVRCMFWKHTLWEREFNWLVDGFDGRAPAAMSAR